MKKKDNFRFLLEQHWYALCPGSNPVFMAPGPHGPVIASALRSSPPPDSPDSYRDRDHPHRPANPEGADYPDFAKASSGQADDCRLSFKWLRFFSDHFEFPRPGRCRRTFQSCKTRVNAGVIWSSNHKCFRIVISHLLTHGMCSKIPFDHAGSRMPQENKPSTVTKL